jgi:putative spermidine/putrescine transport system ATP-binding protein
MDHPCCFGIFPKSFKGDLPQTRQTVFNMMQANSIEFREVTRKFGKIIALHNFSLNIEPGELVTLLGPSGCGKTTALRVLAGIDNLHSGTVSINREDLTSVPAYRRNIGMVFQAYSLFPNMSVSENISYGLRMRGVNASKRREKAGKMLDLVGMSTLADRMPSELSGGQQQRVALARALAIEPRVLLLDEPLSALDAQIRTQIREEIRRLQKSLGITTIFVSHDQEEAMSISDRIGVLNHGVLEQIDTPRNIYNNPKSTFVAEFVGLNNKLPGLIVSDHFCSVFGQNLRISNGSPSDQKGREILVLIRPESILLSKDQGRFRIISKSFLGSITRFEIECGIGSLVSAELGSEMAKDFDTGDFINMYFNTEEVMVAKL